MTQAPGSIPPPGGTMQPHRGTMILVFGILGFMVCVIFGIVAWIMGNNDLAAMQAGQMDPSGEGLTKAGKIVGMVSVILSLVGIVVVLIFIVLGGALAAAGAAGGG